MRTPAFALPGLFALLASCAPVAEGGMSARDDPPRAHQCFSVSQVNNFRQGGASQLFLRVGRGDVYELNGAGGCVDLDFANQLVVIPDGGLVGTRLCAGDWARIVAPGSASRTTVCRVRVSHRLTAEEIANLPSRHRP